MTRLWPAKFAGYERKNSWSSSVKFGGPQRPCSRGAVGSNGLIAITSSPIAKGIFIEPWYLGAGKPHKGKRKNRTRANVDRFNQNGPRKDCEIITKPVFF